MRTFSLFVLKHFLFWMSAFALARITFMLFYIPELQAIDVSMGELCKVLFHAWRLDISTTCYLSVVVYLFLAIQLWFKNPWGYKLIWVYVSLILLLYFALTAGEIGLYREWLSKVNYKALLYLKHPGEALRSISTGMVIGLTSLIVFLSAAMSYLYGRWVIPKEHLKPAPWWFGVAFIIVFPGILFLGLRGGWQQIPIQQSDSYFSKKPLLNDIAVNTAWNLTHSIMNSQGLTERNPFVVMPPEEAEAIVAQMHAVERDSVIPVLKTSRPNIILVILESFSADMLGSLGGLDSVTPFLDSMADQGISFTQTYSGGKRSQQGLCNILAGYPALPQIVLFDFPEKSRKIPTLNQELKKLGYHSSLYFGGDLIYGNIRSFIYFNGFDRVLEESDFDKRIPRGKLGIHDQYVIQKQFEDINNDPQPFFSVLFNSSSHPPFDQDVTPRFNWDIAELPYINSVHYVDQCLRQFYQDASKQAWFQNTVFIFVADHSRRTHINWTYYDFGHIHIPMIITGPAIKEAYRGMRVDRYAGQLDLPSTILAQMGVDHSSFVWSKNLLNPYSKNFVWVEQQEGPGYRSPQGSFVYDSYQRRYRYYDFSSADSAQVSREGMAYLQKWFQDFIDL